MATEKIVGCNGDDCGAHRRVTYADAVENIVHCTLPIVFTLCGGRHQLTIGEWMELLRDLVLPFIATGLFLNVLWYERVATEASEMGFAGCDRSVPFGEPASLERLNFLWVLWDLSAREHLYKLEPFRVDVEENPFDCNTRTFINKIIQPQYTLQT